MGLGRGQAQPRLGQDVLAGLQGRGRDGAVQIGPGADDDGVDVAVGNQFLPVAVGARDAELPSDGRVEVGRRLQTATISTSGIALKPGICRSRVLAPAPIKPMRRVAMIASE